MNLRNLTSTIRTGGVSYSTLYGNLAGRKGYAVSIHKERETILPLDTLSDNDIRNFMLENSDLLADRENFLGAWTDEDKVYLDVSTFTTSKYKALRMAKQAGQKAIFDLMEMRTVWL